MHIVNTLAAGAAVVYAVILSFLLIGVLRRRNGQSHVRFSVSVVIAARNEAQDLPRCLEALQVQTYPADLTELIVVDDRSTDSTPEILQDYSQTMHNLRTFSIRETPSGISPKKHALGRGIEAATGDLIFTTDADCVPHRDWLATMVPCFTDDVGVVIGPAPLSGGHGLLSRLLALDSLAAMFVAAGSTGWNVPATCTGRNLAYRKQAYDEVGGFQNIQHSLSGDDDLFLQLVKRQTSWRVRFALKPKAVVHSPALGSFQQFVRQRRRHVSASKYYTRPSQATYLLFNLANLAMFVFLAYCILTMTGLSLAIPLFCMKLALDFCALFLISGVVNDRRTLFLFPAWEIFFILNQTLISPLGLFGKPEWKTEGRAETASYPDKMSPRINRSRSAQTNQSGAP